MPKSTKRFVLSNENLNDEGFRVITSGVDLSGFKSDPQLYWLLNLSLTNLGDTALTNSYWTDIQNQDKEISAVPFFNDSDPIAMRIYNMVEHGSIRAVNVVFDYLEFDNNISNWKHGQTLPTVLKSKISKVSLSTGLTRDGEIVTLRAPANLICLKHNSYSKNISFNNSSKNMDTNTTKDSQGDEHTPETKAIFKNAVESGKFTQAQIDNLSKLTTTDPKILSAMKGVIKSTPIKPENITGKYHHTLITQAATKSYDEINNEDCRLAHMKANAPELYKAKFFEKFGRLPGDVN